MSTAEFQDPFIRPPYQNGDREAFLGFLRSAVLVRSSPKEMFSCRASRIRSSGKRPFGAKTGSSEVAY